MRIVNPEISLDWLRANFTGKGVAFAVVDSGVEASHPALEGRVKHACEIETVNEQIVCREVPADSSYDSYGHGTAVAGMATMVSPEADIASVKVLNQYNRCTGDALIRGIEWALDNEYKLINLSLATSKMAYHSRMQALAERAYEQESLLVASKRNFGDLGLPAMLSSVISVDRHEFDDPLRLRYIPRSFIEFGAHGTNIKLPTRAGAYAVVTGSSFAAPFVTGLLALLLEAFPKLRSWEAKAILKSLANDPERNG